MTQISAVPTSHPCPSCGLDRTMIEQVMNYYPDAAKHYSLYMITCHNPACNYDTTLSVARRNHVDNALFSISEENDHV